MKKSVFFMLALCFVFSACSRTTKEDTIISFKRFVQNAEKQCKSYAEENWLKSDKRFNRYVEVLERRYGKKLTEKEQIVIAVYRLRYDAAHYEDAVKSNIEAYIENDFKEDVDFLIQQGVKITDIISESLQENLEGKNAQ
jgi:hypothetical protein